MGQPFVYPNNKMGYAENFLNMMFGTPCDEPNVSPVLARAMDRIFLLHADHEQNASTSTVRLAGSSGANPLPVLLLVSQPYGAPPTAAPTRRYWICWRKSAMFPTLKNTSLRQRQKRSFPPDGLWPPRL